MITLISKTEAARHLRLNIEPNACDTPDLELKIKEASQITFGYYDIPIPEQTSPMVASPTYDLWANDPSKIPYDVRAFCCLVLGSLWENREAETADIISDAIRRLGRLRRGPTLA